MPFLPSLSFLPYLLLAFLLLLISLSLRLLYVLRTPPPPPRRRHNGPIPPDPLPHVLILLGSGGHTGEMLQLLSSLHERAQRPPSLAFKRTYVLSDGDTLSAQKALAFENRLSSSSTAGAGAGAVGAVGRSTEGGVVSIHTIPRARRVRQSWLSTPWSCVRCFMGVVRVLREDGVPDVVVLNGPGAAVVVVAVVLAARMLGLAGGGDWDAGEGGSGSEKAGGEGGEGTRGRRGRRRGGRGRCVYVESFARVKSLSLSGRILYYFVDRFIVQWEGLRTKWPRAEYHGILV